MKKEKATPIEVTPEEEPKAPEVEAQNTEQVTEDGPSYEYRFIKLNNGDDILCQVPSVEIDGLLLVRYPLKVSTLFDPNLDEAVYMFVPWVPFTAQELISINKVSVVTITTIRDQVKEIYLKRIEAFRKHSMNQVPIPDLSDRIRESQEETPDPPPPDADEEIPEELKEEQERLKKLRWVN